MKYHFKYNNNIICYFGVKDNYVWFKKTRFSDQYKIEIIKNVKKVFNSLLNDNEYLYTFSLDNKKLNKWHSFIGMKIYDDFIFKNKKYNIWVA